MSVLIPSFHLFSKYAKILFKSTKLGKSTLYNMISFKNDMCEREREYLSMYLLALKKNNTNKSRTSSFWVQHLNKKMNKLKKRSGMILIKLSTVIISVSRFRGNGYFYFVLNLLDYFKYLIMRMNYTCNDKNICKWFKSPNPTCVFHRILTSYRPHLHLLLISPLTPPPPLVRNPDF